MVLTGKGDKTGTSNKTGVSNKTGEMQGIVGQAPDFKSWWPAKCVL